MPKRGAQFSQPAWGTRTLWSDVAHAVLCAERIRRAMGALRVVAPFTVHDEPVFMPARLQRKTYLPDAIVLMAEQDGIFLPVGEVAEQQHFFGVGGDELERFFFHVLLVQDLPLLCRQNTQQHQCRGAFA